MATTKTVDLGQQPLGYTGAENSFKAAGYHRGRENHPGARLISVITFKWWTRVTILGQGSRRYDSVLSGYLFEYPVTRIVNGRSDVYIEKKDSSFFDDTLEERLGGAKEVLGG